MSVAGQNQRVFQCYHLKTFNNEIEAEMAQQVFKEAGVTAFVFRDDAGGREPQLERTNGVVYSLTVPTPKMPT
jgi:hypothetical protein